MPLAGREADLQSVVDALGRGQSVVLGGRLGVGKSELLAQLPEVMQRSSVPTLAISCHAAASRIPFGALVGTVVRQTENPTAQMTTAIEAIMRRKRGRLIVLVDDIQHIDASSVAVLHKVLDDPQVQLVATVRSSDKLPEEITHLWLQVQPLRIELQPLSEEWTQQVVNERLAGRAEPAVVRQIAERSGGNPLFAVELAAAHAAGADTGLTPHLLDVVGHRVDALGDTLKAVLTKVAIGEPLDAALLPQHAAAFGELERAGLIVGSVEDGRMVVRTSHPVYGEVVRHRLTPLQRNLAARELASAVQAAPARRRGDALRIVNWLLDSGDLPAPDLARAAAWEALAGPDAKLAEHLAMIAVDTERNPESLYLLGEVRRLGGEREEAAALWTEAFASADADVDIHRLAMSLSELHTQYLRRNAAAVSVLESALERIEDPGLRISLESAALFRRDKNSVAEYIDESRALFDDPDCDDLSAWSIVVKLVWMSATSGYLPHTDELVARARALEDRLDPEYDSEVDLVRAVITAIESLRGPTSSAVALGEAWSSDAARRRRTAPVTRWAVAFSSFGRGDLRRCRTAVDESLAQLDSLDRYNLQPMVLCLAAMEAAARGDTQRAAEMYERTALTNPGDAPFLTVWQPRARAWCSAANGDFDAAASAALEAGHGGLDTDDVAWTIMAFHDALAFGASPNEVAPIHELVARTNAAPLLDEMGTHAHAAAARDVAALESCWQRLIRLQAWLPAAAVAADLAVLTSASVACRWAANARAAMPTVPLRPEVATLAPSPRHMEIALRAARGTPSKTIADELFVSPRTVDNRLGELYRWLDIPSRRHLRDVIEVPDLLEL